MDIPSEVEKHAKLMKELLERSERENREYEVFFCRTPKGELVTSPVIAGGRDYVVLPEPDVCERGGLGREEGSFHTHPRMKAPCPSAQDVTESACRGHRYICVGGGGTIACWVLRPPWAELAWQKKLGEKKD